MSATGTADTAISHEATARADLAAAFRWTARLGFHEAVSNHFSLALDASGAPFLIQPAGRHFSRVRASELLKVDADGTVLDGGGQLDATAMHIHAGIHRTVPGARCVLHTHMPYATALTCLEGGRLEPISQNALKFYERVAYDTDFAGMALDDDEGERLASMLREKPVLFMGNHGVTVVGESVADAFDRLYFLEKACETQVLAMSTGMPLKRVDDATARATRDQWESYPGLKHNHWAEIRAILDAESPGYRD
ncbi:Ribulose-5-phosphate 4-epimerase/Fuculose-1-phosphate aldolase [Limimonas halophila]|uniref:Ribulose-5-phosphate 4-epimerase/Fuculose-1-phosphate aldolase n=1 Tax=Limimonas halophila TaxID=1082479 RepID=A0A1G7Q139_9PROT|nr:aldolase [Limimonas halophila]SDF91639.1 Ribulose-5-phosphate 4-epimerase/Fuculose-1-phosphate aldolase [Limimonas halophila]